jgi:CheY-like chemotaxis protein
VAALSQWFEVAVASSVDEAMAALRRDEFVGVFSDAGDFLPLERAMVSQQASLVLNTVGEGVCIVDGQGRCNWMNKRMQAWPARVHEKIRRTCSEALDYFVKHASELQSPASPKSRRYALNIEEQQFMELIASPVLTPSGQVVQVVAVVWDATSTRRLQQKIDAIDRAGRELMQLQADLVNTLNMGQRLKLLEEKIVGHTRELMHFDHFAIRLLDRKSSKLEVVMSSGLPVESLNIELFARSEGNGISGYVAATGRSYICPDVERDPRYVQGLDRAMSTLTVPLRLHDKVIGVFNVESRQRAAFNEDDRQFAEIFGRYIAMALNTLDLLVRERVEVSHKVADNVITEIAGPLNDIAMDASGLIDDFIGNDPMRGRLQAILDNVTTIRSSLRQVQAGTNTTVLGVKESEAKPEVCCPVIGDALILVVDDEPNIRETVASVLRRQGAKPIIAESGQQAIELLGSMKFDLVLSDIKMPDKTGYDIFAAASLTPHPPPVILMTGFGYDPAHCIVRASQEGLSAVLFKPFRVEQLLEEVRKALRARTASVAGHA